MAGPSRRRIRPASDAGKYTELDQEDERVSTVYSALVRVASPVLLLVSLLTSCLQREIAVIWKMSSSPIKRVPQSSPY